MLDKNTGGGNGVIYEYWFARMKNISDSKKKKLKRHMVLGKRDILYRRNSTQITEFPDKKGYRTAENGEKAERFSRKNIIIWKKKELIFVPYFSKTYPKRLSDLTLHRMHFT